MTEEFVQLSGNAVIRNPKVSIYADEALIYVGGFAPAMGCVPAGDQLAKLDCYVLKDAIGIAEEVLGGPDKYRIRATEELECEPSHVSVDFTYSVNVAMEIVGAVANIGGAAVVVAAIWKATSNVYQRLVADGEKGRPLISLGAASHLAAADLCMRLGADSDVTILGKGAIENGRFPTFWVTLIGPDRKVASYLVSLFGVCTFIGIANIPNKVRRNRGGFGLIVRKP